MENSNIKKYKYMGKVRNGCPPNVLIYLSNGEADANGLVEVKHQATGDVFYYSVEQFKKCFKQKNK